MKEKISIGIIVLTFIVSLNPYALIFTIPVFIIGVLLLWFSKKKILTKTLWTILPVILWYPTFGIFMYLSGTIGTSNAQKFDFIFPNKFKGDVVLVGNISCGQSVKINNGREQLFIPNNGILLYQGEVETGYVNHKYYYQLDNGGLQPLPDIANYMYFDSSKKSQPTNIVGVWLGGTGSRTNLEEEPKIEYNTMTLTVDSKDSISLHYDYQKEKRFEHLTDSLIRACAKRKISSKPL